MLITECVAAAAAAKPLQSCLTLCDPKTAAHQVPLSWDSPGKNTGVVCHFLLQCMKVKSEGEVTQSCLTFSDPRNCSPPGSFFHGIFQARVLEWGAIAFSGSMLEISHKGVLILILWRRKLRLVSFMNSSHISQLVCD